MAKKKAIRILFQDEPIETGRVRPAQSRGSLQEYPVVFEFRMRERVELVDVGGVFEGVCRCTVDGQDTVQTVLNIPLDLSQLHQHQIQQKEKRVLPSGIYRVPGVINIAVDTPGSFKGKLGAIAYRFRITARVRRGGEEARLHNDREVDVVGSTSMTTVAHPDRPVALERQLRRKFLCFNVLDAVLRLEVERAAFVPGEHVLVVGDVANGPHSSALKDVVVELRQNIVYKSGAGSKSESHAIRRVRCGACASGAVLKLHHSVQVPPDLYPSLVMPSSAIQVFYELTVGCAGFFAVDVPVFVGRRRRALAWPESPRSATPSSSCRSAGKASSSSLRSDARELWEASERPPPYPGHPPARPYFVPVNVQPRVFRPAFCEMPPRYSPPFQRLTPSPPTPPRFLKIEEID